MRLIDADALLRQFESVQKNADRHGRGFANCFYDDGGEVSTNWYCVEDMVENAPTVDVPERNVGEWIWMGDKGDSRFMCSVCKGKENVPTIMGKPIVWDYCPNCGARMESEE